MSRFDYVKYDIAATDQQAAFKAAFQEVERLCGLLKASRPASLALTKLEEAYMWVGKAIRDDQIARGGSGSDQPTRG